MIALFEFHLDFLVFEYVLHGRMAVEVLFSPSMVECFAKVPASAGTRKVRARRARAVASAHSKAPAG